jgi:hypothetical protein
MNQNLQSLMELQGEVSRLNRVRAERDERIASLIRYNHASVKEVMGVTGLTRSRIYQIVSGHYPDAEVLSK